MKCVEANRTDARTIEHNGTGSIITHIDLDAGYNARVRDGPDKGSAVLPPLADRLVVEDDAADASPRPVVVTISSR
jgi:hypothetical protein